MGLLNNHATSSRTGRALIVSAALLALALVGCPQGAPTETNFGARDLGDSGGSDGGDLGATEAVVVPTIDGTWLHYAQLSTCVTALTILEEGISRILYVVDATQTDHGVVTETWNGCSMEMFPVLNIQTYLSPDALASVYPETSTGGFVSSTAVGGAYTSGLVPEMWGVVFDDPINEPFPETTDDPRITDTDGDGNPGLSVQVSDLCLRFTAQRTLSTFTGYFVAPDRIEGSMNSDNEAISVGGSTDFCATAYSTRPNEARSQFVRIRVDGQGGSLNLDENSDGTISCDEVLPYTDELFEKIFADPATCEQ